MKYKIKALRVGKGIKATEFARQIGISREYLSLIEKGQAKNPSRDIMIKIAKELDSTVQELFFSDEE